MRVVFTEDAERNLKRIGRTVASRIVSKILWFADHFEHQVPESLVGKFKGLFKIYKT